LIRASSQRRETALDRRVKPGDEGFERARAAPHEKLAFKANAYSLCSLAGGLSATRDLPSASCHPADNSAFTSID
jgi:hypothetical protein